MTSNLRRVNLLPPEVGAERSQTKVRVIVIVANVALIAILGLLYVMKVGEVGAANSDLKAQQAKNEGVRSQINDPALQQVVQKDAERTARVQMVSTALGGEMSFPRFLNEISLMLPKGCGSPASASTPEQARERPQAARRLERRRRPRHRPRIRRGRRAPSRSRPRANAATTTPPSGSTGCTPCRASARCG